MTPQDWIAALGLLAAVVTVIATVAVARAGWNRDRGHRDDALLATCATAMCNLLQARYAPLVGNQWTPFDGAKANEYHTAAIAAMNSVSKVRRDHEFLRSIAEQSVDVQEESIRYRRSGEHRDDVAHNRVGQRRGAIFDAAAMMQEDILLWQERGSRAHARSFWSHYAEQLIDRTDDLASPRSSNLDTDVSRYRANGVAGRG